MKGQVLAAPKISVVSMDSVPEPETDAFGKYAAIYSQLRDLKAGEALQVQFPTAANASYAKTRIKEIAKRGGRFLSGSRSPDGSTRYFWLEPKDFKPR